MAPLPRPRPRTDAWSAEDSATVGSPMERTPHSPRHCQHAVHHVLFRRHPRGGGRRSVTLPNAALSPRTSPTQAVGPFDGECCARGDLAHGGGSVSTADLAPWAGARTVLS